MRRLAGEPGFEPGLVDPESTVLPLDDSPSLHDFHYDRPGGGWQVTNFGSLAQSLRSVWVKGPCAHYKGCIPPQVVVECRQGTWIHLSQN